MSCEVCCRFPEPDSALRPYFTDQEIRRAAERGIDPAHFPAKDGCQVNVVPNPAGEGYLCPAFDPATSECRIYEARPLDCQIYPLAVLWDAHHREVVLGWDRKCPFLSGERPEARGVVREAFNVKREAEPLTLEAYAGRIASLIEREDILDTFARHPRLIGPFQEDVVILRPLPRLTARLRERHEARGVRLEAKSAFSPRPSPLAPRPLTLSDRQRVEQALASSELSADDAPLAACSFAYHFVWRALLPCRWAVLEGHLCLFAESPDGIFLALPPLGPGPLKPALDAAFEFMRERNGGSSATRVENVPARLAPQLESWGYRLWAKPPDYLYRTSDLARLAGDRYKSQRAACNRFEREHPGRVSFEPYRADDREACEALFRDWSKQKQRAERDWTATQMLADSASAHREMLGHPEALGLTGAVARIDGAVRAYTFGYRLAPAVFCVWAEVTDRTVPGLAAWVFREFCRHALRQGYEFVNTMDDSGLSGLARSKRAYHPDRLLPNWIASVR
ncbi:MAG: phosphatidylglycerol lysyltransferase domain-containing protein [Nitrospirota bacterium]